MFTTRPAPSRKRGWTRLIIIFCALAFSANLLYTASSKSSSGRLPKGAKTEAAANDAAVSHDLMAKINEAAFTPGTTLLTPLMPQAATPETITTYASDCTTLKSDFILGEAICVKVSGLNPSFPRSVTWTNAAGFVVRRINLTGTSDTFTIPGGEDFTLTGTTLTATNRGRWRVNLVPVGRSVVRASAFFSVSNPNNPVVDLTTYNVATTPSDQVLAGDDVTYKVYVSNQGPNDAQSVQVTASVPENSTFVSAAQNSGPSFSCTNPPNGGIGSSTCTLASLAKGTEAVFTFVYKINAGTPKGTVISTNATISSTTGELNVKDNSWTARAVIAGEATDQSCDVTCPVDITVTADTEQNGVSGAIVNFSFESAGTCGSLSASKPSGSFFPVGQTNVSVTSSEGGGSCSFNVNVLPSTSPAPTISCPANLGGPNQPINAANGCEPVAVNVGTPTYTGTDVTLESERSDGQPVDAPYPPGTTTITWTATDSANRSVSCAQTVTVTVNDTTAPVVTAPPDVNIATPPGADNGCGLVVGETELGTATVTDACSTSIKRTGVPSGNFFPLGTTTITYTATDAAGNESQPVTQKVTVTDGTAPAIFAPPDAAYVCRGEVPAGDPSQAFGPDLPNGQPGPVTDNCTSTPVVTVADTDNGGAGSASNPLVITRTFTATDSVGNKATAVQTITVIDTTPPSVTAPPDVVLNTGNGATSCGVTINNLDGTLGAGSASDNCSGATVTRGNVPAGNIFPVGDTFITYTATDAAGNQSQPVTQKVTVVDNTAPVIAAPADVTLYTGAGATSCSVTVSNADAQLGTPTVSDNCQGVTWARGGGSVFPLGETTVTYTATDARGNTATATQKVTVVDNTPPVVTPPANITVYLPLNSTATSMVVNYPNPATATDNCAGAITFSYSPASGSTFPVGPTTVTVTATDAHGNQGQATFTVTVLYNFTGFFSPVNNLPTLNVVKAGAAVPVKFSLSGNKGLNIFALNSPQSGVVPCDASAPAIDLTQTVTAGGSSLSYDASSDQYNYVWKTEGSWAGTCRQLVVKLNDGSVHVANFKFK